MFLQIISIALLGINFIFIPSVYSNTCVSRADSLKIYLTGDDDTWQFTWSANEIQKKKSTYSGAYSIDRTNIVKGASDKRSDRLPQDLMQSNKRLDIPFDIEPTGVLLIASIYNNSFVLVPSKELAIINIKRRQIIGIIKSEYYVNSLAWAPNKAHFAVLYSQDVTKQTPKRFKDWFSNLIGHPISYKTFYVAIYNSQGVLVCIERISERIPLGRGYIEWNH